MLTFVGTSPHSELLKNLDESVNLALNWELVQKYSQKENLKLFIFDVTLQIKLVTLLANLKEMVTSTY